MIIKEIKQKYSSELATLYPIEEIHSFFHLLGEHVLGYKRFEMTMKALESISDTSFEVFMDALERLKGHEPIQYIIGKTEFYGLPFNVNTATLIPRPETEELVSWVLDEIKSPNPTILDIGTGSGCIAISLAKNLPNAAVEAVDISEEALKTSTQNAIQNEVVVSFFKNDILNVNLLDKTYDVIVSNPPYVRDSEKQMMHENVLGHEPIGALFVKDVDPLLFYRAISRLAIRYLEPGGALFFEINEYLGDEMKQLVKEMGFQNIELRKDIFGKDRMLRCNRPK